ncbi:MAG TPA: hypothetical protein VKZ45_02665 [Vicingaceae bacterium]|nr:hypothetical protein [Vicingaceae bacterium]
MKTILNLLLIGMLVASTSVFAQQQKKLNTKVNKETIEENQVLQQNQINTNDLLVSLNRTNNAIDKAYQSVQKNKVYSGNLAKAVYHQKLAKKYLKENNNYRALHHTRVARFQAFMSIRANKEFNENEWDYTQKEQEMFGKGIPNDELTTELNKTYSAENLKDETITEEDLKDIEVAKVATTNE